MDAVLRRAEEEAGALADAGFDGMIVENYGDAPFHPRAVPPVTIAALTLAVAAARRACALPIGVNVLRNDAHGALAIAAATGASFIRVNVHAGAMLTDQGWITGQAHHTVRLRERLAPDVAILADVLVKHATPPAGLDIADAARDTWLRGRADGLIVTGRATGSAADDGRIRAVRAAVPDAPIWLGSGLTPDNAATLLPLVDGAIVGSTLRAGGIAGRPLDRDRIALLVAAVRRSADTQPESEIA